VGVYWKGSPRKYRGWRGGDHAPVVDGVAGVVEDGQIDPAEVGTKRNELANVGAEGLGEVIAAAWHGIERIRAAWHLPYSFLRHAGLSVS
jgi:hypothetical protein